MKNSIFCLQLQYSLLFTLKTKFLLEMVKPGYKHKHNLKIITSFSPSICAPGGAPDAQIFGRG